MTDLEKALEDIADIRDRVQATRAFHGFGPLVVAATGVLGLIAGALQATVPALQSGAGWMNLWHGVALIAVGLIFGEMALRRRKETQGLSNSDLWTAFERFMPAFFTGGALSLALWSSASDLIWLLPGLWSILLGLGLFAALPTLPGGIRIVAGWYLLAGLGALIWALGARATPPLVMVIPFAGGQFLMAFQLERAKRRVP